MFKYIYTAPSFLRLFLVVFSSSSSVRTVFQNRSDVTCTLSTAFVLTRRGPLCLSDAFQKQYTSSFVCWVLSTSCTKMKSGEGIHSVVNVYIVSVFFFLELGPRIHVFFFPRFKALEPRRVSPNCCHRCVCSWRAFFAAGVAFSFHHRYISFLPHLTELLGKMSNQSLWMCIVLSKWCVMWYRALLYPLSFG